MRPPLLAAALACAAAPARAHTLPIHPVLAELRATGGDLLLCVDSNAIYWQERVLGAEPPARDWPPAPREAARERLARFVSLSLDGQPLAAELLEARYIQEPWQDWKSGRVLFSLRYALPRAEGTLSGRVFFFSEELAEETGPEGPEILSTARQLGFPREYLTVLRVRGRGGRTLRLTPAEAAFSFPLRDAVPSAPQAAAEFGRLGAGAAALSPAWLLWAAALALGRHGGRGAATAGAAAAALVLLTHAASPLRGPAAALGPWALAALAALAARLRAPFAVWAGAAVAAGALWSPLVKASAAALPYPPPTGAAAAAYAAGFALAGAAAYAAAAGLLAANRRALKRHTESRADALFEDNARASAALALLAALVMLARAALRTGDS